MSYYATLAAKGFIPIETLATFGAYDSPLGHHPDRMLIRGVEISSGSLGHGLPIAIGLALGLQAQERGGRVVVLVGDAELDEGSNHEAIVLAGRLGLDRLTVVVVENRSATYGWPGGIAGRFEIEGWTAATVDGRDHAAVEAAFSSDHIGQPMVVVAVVEEGA
jgi:transketolase